MNNLRNAFLHALAAHNMTQTDFAARAGCTQSAITKFLQGATPRNDLFRAIFSAWPTETGKHLLRAHMSDEIERSGLRLEDFRPALDLIDNSLEQDLLALDLAMRKEPSLRDFIRKTADIFRATQPETTTSPQRYTIPEKSPANLNESETAKYAADIARKHLDKSQRQ